VLKNGGSGALRIEYFRQSEFLCAKIAIFFELRKLLLLNDICFAAIWKAANNSAVQYKRFDRSL